MPGDHKPVAAVVAASAQDQKRVVFRIFVQQCVGAAFARQLHQLCFSFAAGRFRRGDLILLEDHRDHLLALF